MVRNQLPAQVVEKRKERKKKKKKKKKKERETDWTAFVSRRYESIPILQYLLCRVCPLVSRPGPHTFFAISIGTGHCVSDSILVIRCQAQQTVRARWKSSADAARECFFRRDFDAIRRVCLPFDTRYTESKEYTTAPRVFVFPSPQSSKFEPRTSNSPPTHLSPTRFPQRSPHIFHTILRSKSARKSEVKSHLRERHGELRESIDPPEFPRLKPTSFLVKTITPGWDRSPDNARYNDGSGGVCTFGVRSDCTLIVSIPRPLSESIALVPPGEEAAENSATESWKYFRNDGWSRWKSERRSWRSKNTHGCRKNTKNTKLIFTERHVYFFPLFFFFFFFGLCCIFSVIRKQHRQHWNTVFTTPKNTVCIDNVAK